jgi:hypothetical protein
LFCVLQTSPKVRHTCTVAGSTDDWSRNNVWTRVTLGSAARYVALWTPASDDSSSHRSRLLCCVSRWTARASGRVMKARAFATASTLILPFLAVGCGFASYTKVPVNVVDQTTRRGIADVQLETFYVKPTLDMTYQRRDQARTDADGYATITVATNSSQWFILGSTHGIFPHLRVEAPGYPKQEVPIPEATFRARKPFVVQLTRQQKATTTRPFPFLRPIPARPGFYFAPGEHTFGPIDCRGFTPGTIVRSPHSQRYYLIPFSSRN